MRKLIIVKLVLIIIFTGLCGFFYVNYYDMKSNNDKLEFEIKKEKMNIEKSEADIEITKTSIEKLNDEKKDSIWELDSWKLMKEKIEKAL